MNSSGANTSSTNSAAVKIGAGTTNRWLSGYMAELVFYNSDIGATNRAALESYLKSRYNIP